MRVHLVFHASMLKPYHEDSTVQSQFPRPRPSVAETPSLGQEIAKTLDHQIVTGQRRKRYY